MRRLHHNGMNLILSTHNLTLTKAIEDHIISRVSKLEHMARFAINARVTLEHECNGSLFRLVDERVQGGELLLPGDEQRARRVRLDQPRCFST